MYRADDHEAARTLTRELIVRGEALRERAPDNPDTHVFLNGARTKLGLSLLNDPAIREQAPPYYRAAVADIEAAYRLADGDVEIDAERAASYRRLGNALYLTQSHQDAIDAFERAVEIASAIAAADPNDENAALSLRIFKGEMTAPLSALGRFEEAEALLLEAYEAYRADEAASPDDPVTARRVWVHFYFMASHYRQRGMTAESCDNIFAMERQTEARRAAGGLSELDAGNWKIIGSEYAHCYADGGPVDPAPPEAD